MGAPPFLLAWVLPYLDVASAKRLDLHECTALWGSGALGPWGLQIVWALLADPP
jgi:hypothetical protein